MSEPGMTERDARSRPDMTVGTAWRMKGMTKRGRNEEGLFS